MKPLVSIIIPVFNVEKYLGVCLESVCNQTYTNLDIIVVDDGSTDSSGKLVDEWNQKDSRINSFHKKNGGLSDARNFGLDKAKGEFVFFLDSDDFIPNYTITHLLTIQQQEHSDIVIGAMAEVDERCDNFQEKPSKEILLNLNSEQAIAESIHRKYFGCSSCGNLYKKSVLNIKFPIGRLYEDLAVSHVFLSNANKISYTNVTTLCYRQRPGSIIHKFTIKRIDYLKSALELEEFCIQNYPKLAKLCRCRVFSTAINFSLNIDDVNLKNHYELFLLSWSEVKRTRIQTLFTLQSKRIEKIAAFLSFLGPNIERIIWNNFKKSIRKTYKYSS